MPASSMSDRDYGQQISVVNDWIDSDSLYGDQRAWNSICTRPGHPITWQDYMPGWSLVNMMQAAPKDVEKRG